MEADLEKKKPHRGRQSGRKAEKKKEKHEKQDGAKQELTAKQRNPKAFSFHSAVKAHRQFIRTQDIQSKKHHIPVVDRTPLEPPPVIVAIVGGPKVGKTTLLRCLIKSYTKQKLSNIVGPITIVTGKTKRLTFLEVNNDINCMIDIAKVADIVLMLIDATFGIEMEIFEFLEICRAHGSPRIMGILNHLDLLKDNKSLKKKKTIIKHRFQVELYPGAKLFYLSGIIHGEYLKNEVKNLGRFITVMKFRPITFRSTHPHILVDRWEDITDPEQVRVKPESDRNVVLYGYVRGASFKQSQSIHVPGCGDFQARNISILPDPCPFPEKLKKRSLNSKERCLYAPLSGVAGVLFDKDAVYIDLGGSHHGKKKVTDGDEIETTGSILDPLLQLRTTTDKKSQDTKFSVFGEFPAQKEHKDKIGYGIENEKVDSMGEFVTENNLPKFESVTDGSGCVRRRAIFDDGLDEKGDEDDDEGVSSGDESESELDQNDENDEESEEDEVTFKKRKVLGGDYAESSDVESDIEEALKLFSMPKKDKKNSSIIEKSGPARKSKDVADVKIFDKVQHLLSTFTATTSGNKNAISEINESEIEDLTSEDESEEDDVLNLKKFAEVKYSDELKSLYPSDDFGADYEQTSMTTGIPLSEAGQEDEVKSEDNSKDGNDFIDKFRHKKFEEASSVFFKNQSDIHTLRKYIYGDDSTFGSSFEKKALKKIGSLLTQVSYDMEDDSNDNERVCFPNLYDWDDPESCAEIKDCFVTGKWASNEDAEELIKMDDEEEIFGDFEDLETGTIVKGSENKDEKKEDSVEIPSEIKAMNPKERRLEKKRRLKEMFDSEYDSKGDAEHFDALKIEMSAQSQVNKSEFDGLDEETRVCYEGFRAGLYVRMEIQNMPVEFSKNFDPSYPVVVGGLLENERTMGYIKARIKVHRWYPKILKNKDPLILSLGWRRFQSLMFYSKREDNFRLRSLKYARKFLHVEAQFWGPISPVSQGFIALQNISDRVLEFRIAATGVVLEADQSTQIVKKLKLIGYPEKIKQKTVFVKDMFHSDTEVVKFEGVKIIVQSGIRGIIKKSVGQEGLFRATFEDQIKMSDTIILKTWAPVEVTPFCSYVKSLLLPKHEKERWQGMRTVGQVKKDKNIRNEVNPDSLYTDIERRRNYVPLPLIIPKKLQKALPYKDKPKFKSKQKSKGRVLVVKDPEEEKMAQFMKRLKVIAQAKRMKEFKDRKDRNKKYKKEAKAKDQKRSLAEKKKRAYACKLKTQKSFSTKRRKM